MLLVLLVLLVLIELLVLKCQESEVRYRRSFRSSFRKHAGLISTLFRDLGETEVEPVEERQTSSLHGQTEQRQCFFLTEYQPPNVSRTTSYDFLRVKIRIL